MINLISESARRRPIHYGANNAHIHTSLMPTHRAVNETPQ